jgi:hypothetical protein
VDRRRFLETGAAGAAAALAGSACAPSFRIAERKPNEMPPDMKGYVSRIDAGMKRLESWDSTSWAPAWKGNRSEADALGRTALQSMFLTGMVGDLPLQGQVHPEIQARLESNVPLMDEATERMSNFLRAQAALDLGGVQRALRDHGAGPRIITSLDDVAGDLGVSSWRRAQTKALFSNAEWRLRNQPPGLVVSEYLEKVDRLGDSDVTREARQQTFAARLADEAFWTAQEQTTKTKRQARISRGARVLGYGALTFAGGAVLIAVGSGLETDAEGVPLGIGLVLGTVGVITMLVGLIILIVGLATPGP